MAVACSNTGTKSNNNNQCKCYTVPGLINPVLESSHTCYLRNKYTLGEQLGWGQFGVIRVCTDIMSGEKLACKSIAKDRLVTSDDIHSVKLEIEIMSRLSGHPHVVDLKAVYEEQDYVHLVMELCAGGELFHQLEKNGRFTEAEAQLLFRHLMEVVMYCHDKGVVHRDLKPENILLATKSSSSPIKLADFGLATYIQPGKSLYGTVGSPFYIAPEVLAGGYNQAADVWSTGVILYILLSGMPPFWGKTKSRIFDAVREADLCFPSDPWDHVSASARDLVSRMLCKDPAQRLTAARVLDHSWIKDPPPQKFEGLHRQDNNFSCRQQMDVGAYSFSTPLISRKCDVSFGSGSPVPGDATTDFPSPAAFTCKSSFSSLLVDAATPCTPVHGGGAISFRIYDESSGLGGFSSPMPSMPSFAFFSPYSPKEQDHQPDSAANRSEPNTIQRDCSFGELLFRSPDDSSSIICAAGHDIRELPLKGVEVRRAGVKTTFRTLGIHSKRNRTIGLGELEQLDLMVTAGSVIRWASCTHLPSAVSLRSSLVC